MAVNSVTVARPLRLVARRRIIKLLVNYSIQLLEMKIDGVTRNGPTMWPSAASISHLRNESLNNNYLISLPHYGQQLLTTKRSCHHGALGAILVDGAAPFCQWCDDLVSAPKMLLSPYSVVSSTNRFHNREMRMSGTRARI